MQHIVPKPATIAINTSLSSDTAFPHGTPGGGIDAAGLALVGVEMPAAWTAADMTFQASSTGLAGSFKDVFNDDGTEFKITSPAANRVIPLSPEAAKGTLGLRFIKVRSGTSAAPVNQAAERIIRLLFRDLVGR